MRSVYMCIQVRWNDVNDTVLKLDNPFANLLSSRKFHILQNKQ